MTPSKTAGGRTRLTRAEQQVRTRDAILDAAERVFIDRGFHATAVTDIAEAAGYSKGAAYSQFATKDELFLAMIDRRIDSNALAIEAGIDPAQTIGEQARQAGDGFINVFLDQSGWSLLLVEFAAHAARQDELRARFASRNKRLRAAIASLIEAHLTALGLTSPVDADDLATILFALGSGVMLEKLTDPDGVPDSLFGSALQLIFQGIS
jgi:AcrR family transcriptional regulator